MNVHSVNAESMCAYACAPVGSHTCGVCVLSVGSMLGPVGNHLIGGGGRHMLLFRCEPKGVRVTILWAGHKLHFDE